MSVQLQSTSLPQLIFADHGGEFATGIPTTPANSIVGAADKVNGQMDCGSVAATAARQSTKVGPLSSRPPVYTLDACVELAAAPTAGGSIAFYWAASKDAAAATGNPAGLTGADGTYTADAEKLSKMQYIGALTVHATDTVQIGKVGSFQPRFKYGMLVIVNNTSAAFSTTVGNNHFVATALTVDDV